VVTNSREMFSDISGRGGIISAMPNSYKRRTNGKSIHEIVFLRENHFDHLKDLFLFHIMARIRDVMWILLIQIVTKNLHIHVSYYLNKRK